MVRVLQCRHLIDKLAIALNKSERTQKFENTVLLICVEILRIRLYEESLRQLYDQKVDIRGNSPPNHVK